MMRYQVTIYDPNGHYKPISTIFEMPADTDKKQIIHKGLERICLKRYWSSADMKKYGYTKVKMRKVVENEESNN